jgi:spermidine synthase
VSTPSNSAATLRTTTSRRAAIGWSLLLIGVVVVASAAAMRPRTLASLGPVELETRSEFSHIRIRRANQMRTMSFVRDSGEEVVESQVNLQRPHELAVTYTRYMFLSYLFRPQPKKVLIVGLGGGGMIHFLKHHDPQLQVDVVEIDPVVVKLAADYFGVRSEGNVRIITEDAFKLLAETPEKYDVIYMDAFLKPSDDTDATGVPLKLKTEEFYRGVQAKLTSDGVMAFNVNGHRDLADDLEALRRAFGQSYVFDLPEKNGVVVIGTLAAERVPYATLLERAGELGQRFRTGYSYADMVRRLEK